MSPFVTIATLTVLNLGLLWLLMAAPIGRRTIARTRRFSVEPERLWRAVHPLGSDAAWSASVLTSCAVEGRAGHVAQTYSQRDRKGEPVRRVLAVRAVPPADGQAGHAFSATVVDDSTLDVGFWKSFSERRTVQADDDATQSGAGTGGGPSSRLTVEQTDVYRGAAFLFFRWFALRREMAALDHWLRTGRDRKRGWIEHPAMQLAMAVLSVLVLWPFFGLTESGFVLSATLTVVIVLHELGHMAAYRACGHAKSRMLIIPFLGGVAIGGRPYDTLFEVAFCALMGAGMSAFAVVIAMACYPALQDTRLSGVAAAFILICGGFNLLNLAPVVRFDGGQVLRQVLRGPAALGIGSFAAAAAMLFVGRAVGVPDLALIAGLAVFAVMSLSLTVRPVRPKADLDAMTTAQRVLIAAGFVSALFLHGSAVIFAMDRLVM